MKIKNLSYKFEGQANYFFKDLSIEFQAHELNFLHGQNGVGKSTFFKILQGNTSPHDFLKGCIEFDRHEYSLVDGADHLFTCHVKTVQQQFDTMLATAFTFEENLRLANAPCHPTLSPLPNFMLPEFALEFGIALDKKVSQLSGGQRQILAILMALQKHTKILLLDEPTAALDEKNTHMVMKFLATLIKDRNITVLIICHDQGLIKTYAKESYYCIEKQENRERTFDKKLLTYLDK